MAPAKLTGKQRQMLQILAEAKRPLDSNEVAERSRKRGRFDVVAVGRQLVKRGLCTEAGVKYGPKTWTITKDGFEESTRGEALAYAIMGLARYKETWDEVEVGVGREAMIEKARGMLDAGKLRAVAVQGRGTPGWPTPEGEAQVYRGVASGYDPSAIWPVDPNAAQEVERR